MRDANLQPAQSLWTSFGEGPAKDHPGSTQELSSAVPLNGRGSLRPSNPRLDASVFSLERQHADSGLVSHRGECSSGAGRSHGRDVSAFGGRNRDGTPRFDQAVSSGGYLWWYVDALSDDGQYGLSLIAFVGSVFSPYYASAIKKGLQPLPDHHCALNVALYTPKGKLWSMTERPSSSVHRDACEFIIGPSSLHWDGQALHIDIDEWTVPLPRKIRGRVSVYPDQLFDFSTPLDAKHRHHWGPIAPRAKVRVALSHPDQSWSGHAYLDSNEGIEPIAQSFTEWDWSRSPMSDGSTSVLYDCQFLEGEDRLLALRFLNNGSIEHFEAPLRQKMPKTGWRLERRLRSDQPVRVAQQLEDTPFYQRALVHHDLMGERCVGFHETLNAKRFDAPWVQSLLPWRMPRIAYKTTPSR